MNHTVLAGSSHLPTGQGDRRRVMTDLVTTKASALETGGSYYLYESETPPSGGVPAHTQRYDDEVVLVLDGSYTVLVGEKEVSATRGDLLFLPRGTPHGFVNSGSESARMLVLVTPGVIQEEFMEEIADPAERPAWEPDMEKVLAVAPKYGIGFADREVTSIT